MKDNIYDNKNWYIIYSPAGKEKELLDIFKEEFSEEKIKFIFPKMKKTIRRKGKYIQALYPLFPGYLFFVTEDENIIVELEAWRYKILIPFHFLRYKDGSLQLLSEKDIKLLEKLLNKEECLEEILGIQIGDKMKLKGNIFEGTECEILKIKKRKFLIRVRFEFMNRIQETDFPFNYIIKI